MIYGVCMPKSLCVHACVCVRMSVCVCLCVCVWCRCSCDVDGNTMPNACFVPNIGTTSCNRFNYWLALMHVEPRRNGSLFAWLHVVMTDHIHPFAFTYWPVAFIYNYSDSLIDVVLAQCQITWTDSLHVVSTRFHVYVTVRLLAWTMVHCLLEWTRWGYWSVLATHSSTIRFSEGPAHIWWRWSLRAIPNLTRYCHFHVLLGCYTFL